eukprot:CAMPEP_0119152314 /NCGR_PEP_ID=MMETSP1310-20130426/47595_1 /TAXON_ID=464262 /ORGANISM="Genus nov. species nov., Strain RCC2339" /LENGTH=227 /DNA_ID=CAMNT_0007144665 /DNA_START=13 /DNA_END=692 /DNA_ORIENTATION=+
MASVRSVLWFRKGLRVHDNPALLRACEGASVVQPVFVLDPWFVAPERVGGNRLRFLLESLEDLAASLEAAGVIAAGTARGPEAGDPDGAGEVGVHAAVLRGGHGAVRGGAGRGGEGGGGGDGGGGTRACEPHAVGYPVAPGQVCGGPPADGVRAIPEAGIVGGPGSAAGGEWAWESTTTRVCPPGRTGRRRDGARLAESGAAGVCAAGHIGRLPRAGWRDGGNAAVA